MSELEALTLDYPYRERFRAQLMLALYRCGRQAEGLEELAPADRAAVVGCEKTRNVGHGKRGLGSLRV